MKHAVNKVVTTSAMTEIHGHATQNVRANTRVLSVDFTAFGLTCYGITGAQAFIPFWEHCITTAAMTNAEEVMAHFTKLYSACGTCLPSSR